MSAASWQQMLIAAQAVGTTLSDTTTPTSVLPGQAKFTLPANTLAVGDCLRLTVAGLISNVVTTPGTITFDLRFGSTAVFSTGAVQLSTTAHTNAQMWMEVLMTCRSIGASTSATLIGQGTAASIAFSRTTTDATGDVPVPATAPAVGTGFDSTIANATDLFVTFSVATDPTNFTLEQYGLELLN